MADSSNMDEIVDGMSNLSGVSDVSTFSKPCSFPVYLLYSKWSLVQLDNFLKEFGDVGFLRIMYDNDGHETDRTIGIIPTAAYEALCQDGYGVSESTSNDRFSRGFRITPFLLKDNNFPGEGRTKTLFVPVPQTLVANDSQVIETVIDKLKHLAEWEIIPDNSWVVNVPLKSREKGGVQGGCFISFNRDIALERIAMVRTLITDTYWPDQADNTERPVFRCFWARDRNTNYRSQRFNNTAPTNNGSGPNNSSNNSSSQGTVNNTKPQRSNTGPSNNNSQRSNNGPSNNNPQRSNTGPSSNNSQRSNTAPSDNGSQRPSTGPQRPSGNSERQQRPSGNSERQQRSNDSDRVNQPINSGKSSEYSKKVVPDDEKVKEDKKREAIQNVVKKAKPALNVPKKASTIPIPFTTQPTLIQKSDTSNV